MESQLDWSHRPRPPALYQQIDTDLHAHDRTSSRPAQERVPFGPFELTRNLAVGGNARVHLANLRGKATADAVVVKRLLPDTLSPESTGTLMREAGLQQRAAHPGVVRLVDSGIISGEPYIAMEYIEGLDLRRLLQRSSASGQAIPTELAIHVVSELSITLEALHGLGGSGDSSLVHCDVCPSNVLLGNDGRVMLGDFGLARLIPRGQQVTLPEAGAPGHLGYVAPELLTGEPHDHRVDLFALGVLLGELLIGRRVFAGEGELAIMLAVRDGNIQPLIDAIPRLPPGLFEVCSKALARTPAERYRTAGEFRRAMLPFMCSDHTAMTKALGSWVGWAEDESRFVRELEQRVRESVGNLRAAGRSSSGLLAVPANDQEKSPSTSPRGDVARIRRRGTTEIESVPFARLVELVATGSLKSTDEVALWGTPFEAVGRVAALARHLLPSTTATTHEQYNPGPPDHVADLSQVPMLNILGELYRNASTASIFVVDCLRDARVRKEIYVEGGKLMHVASSRREELLGEYLVDQGILSRSHLDQALARLTPDRHLGELLLSLKLVEPIDIFSGLRNQGCARLAELCTWQAGYAQIYRRGVDASSLFPLALDLAHAMYMCALQMDAPLPDGARVVPGPHLPAAIQRIAAVPLLSEVQGVVPRRPRIADAVRDLQQLAPRASASDVRAALHTARALEWLDWG